VLDFDNRRGRYVIEIASQRMALLPTSVILPDSTRVMVTGLQSETQYNGLWGQVQGFDRAQLRYTVQIGSGHQLRLRMDNCLAGGQAACGTAATDADGGRGGAFGSAGGAQQLLWTGLKVGAVVGGGGLALLLVRRLGIRRLISIITILVLLRSGTAGFIML
jgi:hypothetical protein